MLFTRKKITTIVDELTTFFFSVGSDDMVVKIKQKPEGFHASFLPAILTLKCRRRWSIWKKI